MYCLLIKLDDGRWTTGDKRTVGLSPSVKPILQQRRNSRISKTTELLGQDYLEDYLIVWSASTNQNANPYRFAFWFITKRQGWHKDQPRLLNTTSARYDV